MMTYSRLILIVSMSIILSGCSTILTQHIPEETSIISATTLTSTPEPTITQTTMESCTLGKAEGLLDIPDITESVAVASDGTVFTAATCSGYIYQIDTAGISSIIGKIPFAGDTSSCDKFNALGVALAEDGGIWVVVASFEPQYNGIWQIHPNGSTELAYPMDPTSAPLPNDLTFDSDGTLYITESTIGSIWRASPSGKVHQWFTSNLLSPPAGGYGANGIAFKDDALYVGNTSKGIIVRIPIESDGSPGNPDIITEEALGIDGMDFGPRGQLFGVSAYLSRLEWIHENGEVEILLGLMDDGMMMPYPTGLAVSQVNGESTVVYISTTNSAANIYRVNICLPSI